MSDSHVINDYHLLSYDVVDSTNEEARRLAMAGGQHGAVIWANRQEQGKGRRGREWVSDEGNLFCSLLLRPHIELEDAAQLSFVTSLAVYEALHSVVDETHHLALKWPNDILLDGKKLGGILLESIPIKNDYPWVILGLGINIEHFPEQARYPATSLKDSGVEIISAKIVLSRFLNCFLPLYDVWRNEGFAPIRKQWMAHAAFRAERITLLQDETSIEGVFEGIDKHGHCLLRGDDGMQHAHAAGDVSWEK